MNVVDGHRVTTELSWAASTGISEIPEAVKAGGTAPALRISDAEQIAVAEAMIQFDVKLILRVRVRARTGEIGILQSSEICGVQCLFGKQQQEISRYRVDQIARAGRELKWCSL